MFPLSLLDYDCLLYFSNRQYNRCYQREKKNCFPFLSTNVHSLVSVGFAQLFVCLSVQYLRIVLFFFLPQKCCFLIALYSVLVISYFTCEQLVLYLIETFCFYLHDRYNLYYICDNIYLNLFPSCCVYAFLVFKKVLRDFSSNSMHSVEFVLFSVGATQWLTFARVLIT